MIPKNREQFNQAFSNESFEKIKELIVEKAGMQPGFRVSESPIFLPYSFREKLLFAAESILEQIKEIPQDVLLKNIPREYSIPNDNNHPHFITIDFAICKSGEGKPIPLLIELQGFPSVLGYQYLFRDINFEVYPFLKELKSPLEPENLQDVLKNVIVGDEDPKHVILLDVRPKQQKTFIDLKVTADLLGIEIVCLSDIKKKGKELFYEKDGELIKVKRIFNRVILDELDHLKDFETEFDLREEVDVEWITHPNWFYKISKHLLPHLKNTYIPKSYFVKDFPIDETLSDYVLKPLYSFAGNGVDLNPTKEKIEQMQDPEHYVLQEKVEYAKVFEDINGETAKAEIRMLFIWNPKDKEPTYITNLVRMSKTDMINVAYNSDHIWTGSSFAFFVR